VIYQLTTKTELLRVATVSGGDMLEYFVDDEEGEEKGKLN
jgi:hypothetical protein